VGGDAPPSNYLVYRKVDKVTVNTAQAKIEKDATTLARAVMDTKETLQEEI